MKQVTIRLNFVQRDKLVEWLRKQQDLGGFTFGEIAELAGTALGFAVSKHSVEDCCHKILEMPPRRILSKPTIGQGDIEDLRRQVKALNSALSWLYGQLGLPPFYSTMPTRTDQTRIVEPQLTLKPNGGA